MAKFNRTCNHTIKPIASRTWICFGLKKKSPFLEGPQATDFSKFLSSHRLSNLAFYILISMHMIIRLSWWDRDGERDALPVPMDMTVVTVKIAHVAAEMNMRESALSGIGRDRRIHPWLSLSSKENIHPYIESKPLQWVGSCNTLPIFLKTCYHIVDD